MEGRISTHLNLQHKSKLKYKYPKGSCTRTVLNKIAHYHHDVILAPFPIGPWFAYTAPIGPGCRLPLWRTNLPPSPKVYYIVHPRSAEGSWTALQLTERRVGMYFILRHKSQTNAKTTKTLAKTGEGLSSSRTWGCYAKVSGGFGVRLWFMSGNKKYMCRVEKKINI